MARCVGEDDLALTSSKQIGGCPRTRMCAVLGRAQEVVWMPMPLVCGIRLGVLRSSGLEGAMLTRDRVQVRAAALSMVPTLGVQSLHCGSSSRAASMRHRRVSPSRVSLSVGAVVLATAATSFSISVCMALEFARISWGVGEWQLVFTCKFGEIPKEGVTVL